MDFSWALHHGLSLSWHLPPTEDCTCQPTIRLGSVPLNRMHQRLRTSFFYGFAGDMGGKALSTPLDLGGGQVFAHERRRELEKEGVHLWLSNQKEKRKQ
eukprot:scaffold1659_cov255-Pinguiococcus_pyrenoidosus.AAC.37